MNLLGHKESFKYVEKNGGKLNVINKIILIYSPNPMYKPVSTLDQNGTKMSNKTPYIIVLYGYMT